jgi:hypothetical protein
MDDPSVVLIDQNEEEHYWQGLLTALQDSQPSYETMFDDSPVYRTSNDPNAHSSSVMDEINFSDNKKLYLNANSTFVDVNLEDENQAYYKYYKEYFGKEHNSQRNNIGIDERNDQSMTSGI